MHLDNRASIDPNNCVAATHSLRRPLVSQHAKQNASTILRKNQMYPRLFAIALAGAAFASTGSRTADAGLLTDLSCDSCTGINCGFKTLRRTVVKYIGNFAYPWVSQFAGAQGNCLRFDVTSVDPGTDLVITVISPNGKTVYRNDDRILNVDHLPLVKIASAPNTDLHTVQIG
jgi:hypothetical protein